MTQSTNHSILITISSLETGGAQQVASALANAWHRRGWRVCVLTYERSSTEGFALDAEIERITLPYPKPTFFRFRIFLLIRLIRWIFRMRRKIHGSGAEFVISFIHTNNIFTILACLGLRRVRLIISERNDPLRQHLAPPWAILRRLLYRFADRVTANSYGALEAMAAYVPRRKLAFVPNPLRQPSSGQVVTFTAPTFLSVGRLVHQKGMDILLKAFQSVAAEIPEWRLVIVGDGPLRCDLKAQARSLGIDGRVDWVGRVIDPFPYFHAAEVMVLPSRFEGTPNALLEAMSCGLAAVVTDGSPGPLEIVQNEVTGLVVPVEDTSSLAAALGRMAKDPTLRARLGKAGRERMNVYELDRVLEVWETVIGVRPQDARDESSLKNPDSGRGQG